MISVVDIQGSSAGKVSVSKLLAICALFVASLIAFVVQTETTALAYRLGFAEPMILLLVTHGMWWIIWPSQVLALAIFRVWQSSRPRPYRPVLPVAQTPARSSFSEYTEFGRVLSDHPTSTLYLTEFRLSLVKQIHGIYHTAILIYEGNVNDDRSVMNFAALIDRNPHVSHTPSLSACLASFLSTPAIKYVIKHAFITVIVLTIAGFTWYGAMAMTYAADVTAIYNCLAFMAYAFSIPLLHDPFVWTKAAAVAAAVAGVFLVAYSDNNDTGTYPHRLAGNVIIFCGAVLYGLYEVLYKKWLCVPAHLSAKITSRRQLSFANFIMSLFGLFTALILLLAASVAHFTGIHTFNLTNYGEHTKQIWLAIMWLCAANIAFSGSFLSLMALTLPVLSSVSAMLTIFLVGLVEWVLYGTTLSAQQLYGDAFIVGGFSVLTAASWQEILEGAALDDVEAILAYSFAAGN